MNAFNDVSAKTGVTARVNDNGDGITLLNSFGENITIANAASGSNTATIGGTSTAAGATAIGTGQLVLDSDKSFSIDAPNTTDFFNNVSAAGQLQKVADLDVSSVDSAQRTLAIADAALSAINGQRAKFGALQSRFETTISNLQISSENLSASRSRIRDTDFAAETANLTRSQILQQAGTAMLPRRMHCRSRCCRCCRVEPASLRPRPAPAGLFYFKPSKLALKKPLDRRIRSGTIR